MSVPSRLRFFCFFALTLCAAGSAGWAKAQVNVADDSAGQGMYNGGWNDGTGGDNGFFAWKMVSTSGGDQSFAGHYLAKKGEQQGVEAITEERAFALFANGRGFEESVAFRGIAVPLQAGDNFSVDFLHGPFGKKGAEDDPAPGEVGVAYRTGNASDSVADYDKGARVKFFAREGSPNYLVTDSVQDFDTGIPVAQEALAVTITVRDADAYDLEVIGLRDQTRKLFENRKLGGTAGTPIQSLAFFNRDAEAHDFFFNNFQLSRNAP